MSEIEIELTQDEVQELIKELPLRSRTEHVSTSCKKHHRIASHWYPKKGLVEYHLSYYNGLQVPVRVEIKDSEENYKIWIIGWDNAKMKCDVGATRIAQFRETYEEPLVRGKLTKSARKADN